MANTINYKCLSCKHEFFIPIGCKPNACPYCLDHRVKSEVEIVKDKLREQYTVDQAIVAVLKVNNNCLSPRDLKDKVFEYYGFSADMIHSEIWNMIDCRKLRLMNDMKIALMGC